ncbi:MAG TPA: MFS transporter, partial [Ktedonobacteraceae bacterium]
MNEITLVDPRRWWALVVVLAATLMSIIDASIVNVAIPSIQTELHTNTAQIQLVVVGYILAYAIGLVTGGRLGDMFGRKRMFQLGMLVFTLASLSCGIAPNP